MLIGRKEELKTLHQALTADESKFVAIYGRRRVGKTFLVREAFNNPYAWDVQSVVTMDDLFVI